jgi:hypothetical protein
LIEQAAVVPSVLGKPGTKILSFVAPFYCGRCNIRTISTIAARDVPKTESGYALPKPKCPRCGKCGASMELDGLEDDYFRFLDHTHPVV